MHQITTTVTGNSVAAVAAAAAAVATSTIAPYSGGDAQSCGNGTPFSVGFANETTGAFSFVSEGYWGHSEDGGTATQLAPIINIDNQQAKTNICGSGVGNPIYPLLGVKHEDIDTGLRIGGIPITLSYDSSPKAPLSTGGSPPDNPNPLGLGELWSSSLHRGIRLQGNSAKVGALVARGNGSTRSFRDFSSSTSNSTSTTNGDNDDRLSYTGSGFIYTDAAGLVEETYDADGNLTAITSASGGAIALTYSTATTSGIPPNMTTPTLLGWTFGPHGYCWGSHQINTTVTGNSVAALAAAAAAVATSTTAPYNGGNAQSCGNGTPFSVGIANESTGAFSFVSEGYYGHSEDGGTATAKYSQPYFIDPYAPLPGYLLQAQDNQGRVIMFSYQSAAPGVPGRLAQISDSAGNSIALAYDAQGNLATLTWPDGKVKTFKYENSAYPWALTGIVDEANTRYATFGYDANGRAISSEHAGGVNRYSVAYTTPPFVNVTDVVDSASGVTYRHSDWALPVAPVISTPEGNSINWGATSILGKSYITSRSQPAGSGCAASTSTQSYDTNGNLAGRDDFTGIRSCYVNDLGRNLETTRIEGLSSAYACNVVTSPGITLPAGSRKISTNWHPDWRLEAARAEPGRLTTFVYNGQPDPFNGGTLTACAPGTAVLPDGKPIAVLCKQVEQATTDTDGHLGFSAGLQSTVANRIRNWTYDAAGRVLSASGPRTDVATTTTYTYYTDTTTSHTVGDLQSITSPLGRVTAFGKYDAYGNLLESTDANGVVTVNTYDARQRLLSASVGGQTTSYSYDAVGQLQRMTAPDASWIGFEYDAAHRRTAVQDNLGNRIEYTLDNAGNVTAQNIKDGGGGLARTLVQSIDALGRVQQTTGRP